ncbi:MAG: peptidylprolyl isomerase [Bacteroidota bacterium]|nr:peptidylprolyl isomerase [Bacteroidota bacterium]
MIYTFKIIFLLFLFNTSLLFSQQLSFEEREILKLQDERITGEDDRLIQYLYSINPFIRSKVINALANIGDSNFVSKLNFLLAGPFENYPTLNDLKASAFMLGQIQSDESRSMIELMLDNNTDSLSESEGYFINSLGRVGDEINLKNLDSRDFSGDEMNRALAMSLGRFALRKIQNEKSVYLLKKLTSTNDTLTLRNIAFALWRTGEKSFLNNAKQEIYSLSKSNDAQTRMWAYNAMGKLQDKLLLMHTLESFGSENDWRVKINMLNSLTNFHLDSIPDLTKQLYSVLSDAIGDENEHIGLTGINVLGKIFSDIKKSNNNAAKSLSQEIKKEFIYSLDSIDNISWRQKSELANSMSLIFRDEAKSELFKAFRNTNNYDLKSGIIKAFGNFNDGMVYKEVRDTISADVQRYNAKNPNTSGDMIGSMDLAKLYRGFVEMLSNLDEKTDDENQNITRLIFTEFVSSKDPAIVDICLSALKDSLYLKYRDETVSILLFDYNELVNPKDYDLNLIFIDAMKDLNNDNVIKVLENNLNSEYYEIGKSSAEALEKITGKKYEFNSKPRTDFDWDYIENTFQNKFVTLNTNKGEIKIELLPDAAPFTVMNFLKLAEKNFYDGTIFHRVVSNFVIQGGDPTGTGYGGPGYSIRSEFNPLTYERGMVGMASSGKDTEGSQFFITHSSTPHLDARYTIFGKVVEGMDIVDEIMIGDYIENIKLESD